MKRLIFFFLLFSFEYLHAQQSYVIEKDIAYYSDSIGRKDKYLATQCTLDLYYPKGAKNYSTVVWFHGGGITGGRKEIPKELMEKGYAVIGVGYRLSRTGPTQ